MFRNNVFQKITASALFLAIVMQGTAFLVAPQKAEAQASSSASASLGAIGGAAVGCALSNLNATSKIEDLATSASAVPTIDSKVKAEVKAQKEKESCLDAIAYTAAKVALRKVTLSTIQWINTGFKGEPLFVKNPTSFFLSIAQDEINSITGILTADANLYPFGKDLARSIILSTQATFAANAQYSLNKVIGNAGAAHFQADFSAGGWDGWLAATQILANNQIGAHIQTADEVSFRLQGTAQSNAQEVRDKLLQARGFLGLEKCVELNDGSIPDNKYDYSENNTTFEANSGETGPSTSSGYFYLNGIPEAKKCKRYETITPGEAIAGQMNITLGSTTRQLELADELNESIGAVFDALISQLLNKGLSSLSGSGSPDVGVYGGYGNNSNGNSISNSTSVADPDQWYNQNPTFDIWTDLQPIIDLQIMYKNMLWDRPYKDVKGNQQQGGENYILRKQLLPAIYEFDFCVPGPNPLWKEAAQQKIDMFTANLPSSPAQASKLHQFLSNSISFNLLSGIFGDSDNEKLAQIYAAAFGALGVYILDDENLYDISKAQSLTERIFQEYSKKIDTKYGVFGPEMQYILVAADLPAVYNQVPVYTRIAEDNDKEIENRESIIRRLTYIRDQVAQIPKTPMDQLDTLTQAQQDEITVYLRTLGRLAPDLVDENILEKVADDIFVFEDMRNYVTNPSTGLLARCKREVQGVNTKAIRGLRAAYPTDLVPLSVQNTYQGALGGYFAPAYKQRYGGSFLPGVYFGNKDGNAFSATQVAPDLTSYFAVPAMEQVYGPGKTGPLFGKIDPAYIVQPGIWNIQPNVDYTYITDLVNITFESNFSGLEDFLDIY